MPVYKKRQLLEKLLLLERINDNIKNGNANSKEQMTEKLAECQEEALLVGNELETHGEKGEALVQILEDYCEVIYQQSLVLFDDTARRRYCKEARRLLIKIENGIKSDLPEDKKEVIFLPYKASMWDLLESIWMVAENDENCIAYVVPIPYFDRNPDGSLGAMHCEENDYPDYVPVTSWQNFDIEQHRPDVIFIHNPYDEVNLVTSVHPKYYAAKLKHYTDQLVYVPYYVSPELLPDDPAILEEITPYCSMPGILHSDLVIVQSENTKQNYVNEFVKRIQWEQQSAARSWIEEKILGLGSPKFDKIYNTKREIQEIPLEWLKVIEKPDGSRKKIVFYNTSIAALLSHNEQMLKKMEDVFRVFKGYRENVALLWRPHPLILSTIKAMRPWLWENYQSITARYENEGWGIYDDTADMDRAVILSDAYYGDVSSLVPLSQQLNKGIMIQNPTILNPTVEMDLYLAGKHTNEILKSFQEKINEGAILKETKNLTLQNYIHIILDSSCVVRGKEDVNHNAGRNIYVRIMNK